MHLGRTTLNDDNSLEGALDAVHNYTRGNTSNVLLRWLLPPCTAFVLLFESAFIRMRLEVILLEQSSFGFQFAI